MRDRGVAERPAPRAREPAARGQRHEGRDGNARARARDVFCRIQGTTAARPASPAPARTSLQRRHSFKGFLTLRPPKSAGLKGISGRCWTLRHSSRRKARSPDGAHKHRASRSPLTDVFESRLFASRLTTPDPSYLQSATAWGPFGTPASSSMHEDARKAWNGDRLHKTTVHAARVATTPSTTEV